MSTNTDWMRDRIERWLDVALSNVRDAASVDEHIDWVLEADIPRGTMFDIALKAYAILIKSIAVRHAPAIPALFIRLRGVSSTLTLAAPKDMQEIKDQWRDIEPPSLVLLGGNYRSDALVEEYRCPLAFGLLTPPIAGVVAVYS